MTNLQKLVIESREIARCTSVLKELEALHLDPVRKTRAEAGARANVLWSAVLDEYGVGEAQRVLHAALAESEPTP